MALDLMWVAIAVHIAVPAGLAVLVVLLFGNKLPEPWGRLSFTVPVAMVLGAVLALVAMRHWSIFPQ